MTDPTAGNEGPESRRRSDRRAEWLIAIAILCITGPLIQVWTAQPASRYTLSVAVVDDHSLRIDPYVGLLGVDRAVFEGHTYSDKAPYQPLLAVPAYAVFRAAGGAPFPIVDQEQVINRSTHVGLWWVTLWSTTIPAILLTLAVRRLVGQVNPRLATTVALAVTLGTTMLPFTSWLFGHVLAAMWVALAWVLLRPEEPSYGTCLAAGALLGAGIGTEYPVAVVALLLLLDLARQRRWIAAVWLSAGTVLATVPMLVYNWLVFRNPFEVSYQGHLPNFQGAGAFGVFNLTLPQPDEVARALISDRGLFVLTPIALLAVIGCVSAIAEGGRIRRDGWLGIAALVGFVVLSTGIDGLGGDSPGPRYLIPMFPLLAVPLTIVWQRFPRPCIAATFIGGVTMWMAAVTTPDIASTAPNALGTWAQRLRDGDLATNILTGRDHRWVIFVTTAAGLLAAMAAIRSSGSAAARAQ
ncbi:MAG: hypothetical protein ACT4OV_13885 [Microthrixaceae bacterium]